MFKFIAANLPLLVCLLVGLGLVTLEAFIPGFGLPGIAGVILYIIAIALTWFGYGPVAALGLTVGLLAVTAIVITCVLRSAARGRLSKSRIVLKETESNEAGYRSSEDMQVFLEKEGVTTTVLRPTGMAEIDGTKLNVVSDGEFIPQGTKIRVTRVEGSRIVVRTMDKD